MTALDVTVIAVLGGGAILGFTRGFVQEVLALTVWLLILFAVRFLHTPLSEALTGPIGSEGGAGVAAFLILFVGVYIGGRMTARAIGRRTRESVVGPIDRVLGAGFGAIKGLAMLSLLFLLIILVNDTIYGDGAERPGWMTSSRTYPLLNASSAELSEFMQENKDVLLEDDAEEIPANPQ
jgi:membrane protein required for colicin V production